MEHDPTPESQLSKTERELPEIETPPITIRSTTVDRQRHPDLDSIRSVVLREGPRSRKVATHGSIVDRHTGEFHHHALTIKTLRKLKGQWNNDPLHSISLSNEGEDEIQKLLDFLLTVRSGAIPNKSSEFVAVVAPAEGTSGEALQILIRDLASSGQFNVLAEILKTATKDRALFELLIERVSMQPQLFAEAAAALNLATYRNAVGQLQALIGTEEPVRESEFQDLLGENPWMFGSEYSELLDRRRWTRDEQQDFVLRRTTDGYIELIEIKTPLEGADLFRFDSSHDSHYASAELSKVVGQVEKYIEELDADRHKIRAKDGEDTCKIRAKIIIGRDGDEGQQQALRRYNGHLHRIEVLTFDQLLRIAQHVLNYLERALVPGG